MTFNIVYWIGNWRILDQIAHVVSQPHRSPASTKQKDQQRKNKINKTQQKDEERVTERELQRERERGRETDRERIIGDYPLHGSWTRQPQAPLFSRHRELMRVPQSQCRMVAKGRSTTLHPFFEAHRLRMANLRQGFETWHTLNQKNYTCSTA